MREAGAEALVLRRGLPAPNSELMGTALPVGSPDALRADIEALRRAVQLRPDWAEGHLRLGLTELARYRDTATAWLAGSVTNPAERALLSDPLWLLVLVQQGQADVPTLLTHEPIKNHLVPAARSFLEARRVHSERSRSAFETGRSVVVAGTRRPPRARPAALSIPPDLTRDSSWKPRKSRFARESWNSRRKDGGARWRSIRASRP